jgi:energy-coupling factor transport system permease protein
MSVFLYVDKRTALHGLHPVTKVLGLVLGFAIALMFSHPLPALGALLLAIVALAAGGGMVNLGRAWKFLLLLLVMTTLIWSVFLRLAGPMGKGGEADFSLSVPLPKVQFGEKTYGGESVTLVEISRTTLAYGAAMGLRIVACIVFGLAFLTCTRTEDFAAALRSLGAPQGVSVAVSLSFRLVPTLAGTARNVIEAQKSRGVDPEAGSLLRRVRNYVPLITPVLAYALRSADLTAMALESRGLGAHPERRTHYRAFRAGAADIVLLLVLVAIVTGCVVARMEGYGVIGFG